MALVCLRSSESDDEEFELTVTSYTPPTWPTRDDPGSPGEIEFEPVVNVLMNARKAEEISFDEFLDRYSRGKGILDRATAEQLVEEMAMLILSDELLARLEDAQESQMEDR